MSTFIEAIANPSSEESKILLKELPTVIPYPGSSGRNSNSPLNSSELIMITLSGF